MLKKILKISIFILILIILLSSLIIITKILKKDNAISKEENNIIDENIIEIEIAKEENTEVNNSVENTDTDTDTNINVAEKTNDKNTHVNVEEINSKVENNANKKNTNIKNNSQSVQSSNYNNTNGEIQEETIKTPIITNQNEQKETETNTNMNINTVPTTDIIEETKEETKKQNIESFKINNSMIEKIKNIINNNPSETMKKFGYNIVIDSSIINLTTGFTFTENRVKNAINFSAGTIRIYARDYYIDDELRWTECFIL